MNKKAVLIRKWDKYGDNYKSPSNKVLDKQIKTLHSKIKKKAKNIVSEYVIEKDDHKKTYHIHMLVHIDDIKVLYNECKRYIGGEEWIIRKEDARAFDECKGKYGIVHIEEIINENKYRNYISKKTEGNTLI